MTDLNEYSPLLADIDRVCRLQNVPATSSLAEYGPGQYEVNLAHAPGCAARLRRSAALQTHREERGASRMAARQPSCPSPTRDMAGSGLHVHVSLLDAKRAQHFRRRRSARQHPAAPRHRRHARDARATAWRCAHRVRIPIRRFRSEAYVPLHATWSINNRGSAIRVPASDAANLRIEHRLAGADANPYLVVAWVLAGIHHGLTRKLEPPPVTTGNAYEQPGDPLPIHWSEAIERFARSEFAAQLLRREVREPVRHRQARRAAGIRLAHHAAGDRALPGAVCSGMGQADAQNFYYASTPRPESHAPLAGEQRFDVCVRRRRHLRALRRAAPGRTRHARGAARGQTSRLRRLGPQRRPVHLRLCLRACRRSRRPSARRDARRMWDVCRRRHESAARAHRAAFDRLRLHARTHDPRAQAPP